MSGVDTVRGIAYQQAQAVLTALDVLESSDATALRVEGVDDVLDIEVFGAGGTLLLAKQIKTRKDAYTWGEAEIKDVLQRWAALPQNAGAKFEFVTNGRLGPSVERLRSALEAAQEGNGEPLRAIFGPGISTNILEALGRAQIVQDVSGLGASLERAERQVSAMLVSMRTEIDTRNRARQVIDRLHTVLMQRASDEEATLRIITREEIAAILGVPANQLPRHRWPGELKKRYLLAVAEQKNVEIFEPAIESVGRRSSDSKDGKIDLQQIYDFEGSVVIAGRTGSGKSTAARWIRQDLAAKQEVLLIAPAEAYIPQRLEALVADAVSELLHEDLPSATGRQILADPKISIAIDGVSEIPSGIKDALGEDLRSMVASGRGARFILMGRDISEIRSVLPTGSPVLSCGVSEMSGEQLAELARIYATPRGEEDNIRDIVAWVQHSLGDASGNPMLCSMALEMRGLHDSPTSRVTLYQDFIARLAERSGTSNIMMLAVALGVTFGGLLDEGRRHADPFEWFQHLGKAVSDIADMNIPIGDLSSIDSSAKKSGLVNVTGWAQMVVPMHDSIADYLAAVSHVRGARPMPKKFETTDEQRALFVAELGGMNTEVSLILSRDLPFLAVRASLSDSRTLEEHAPDETKRILEHLIPEGNQEVSFSRMGDGRVVVARQSDLPSGWVSFDKMREIMLSNPGVVVESSGPLAVAVRLWRIFLAKQLMPVRKVADLLPTNQYEACNYLRRHTEEVKRKFLDTIARIAPSGHGQKLAAELGPLGLTANVGPEKVPTVEGMQWPVSYVRTADIHIEPTPNSSEPGTGDDQREYGHLSHLARDSPEVIVSKELSKVINRLTVTGWIL